MFEPQRNESRGQVLVQLANEAVVATSFVRREVLRLFVINLRGCADVPGQDAAVTMRSFDSCAVENKDNQEQTDPAREICAAVIKESKHAGL